MTYCLGVVTRQGLVMASDSRTNAGSDQVNVCRKMFTFTHPGERIFIALTSGGLSLSQSVISVLTKEWDRGEGLAAAETMYDAARLVGQHVRQISEIDREALERDKLQFNVHLLLGGQIKGSPPELYLIYPQGNPLRATEECPYLQIGELKYGRPILDRGVKFETTTLEEAAKYALISLDSTMRSNVTVGPPIDLLSYKTDELDVKNHRRFVEDDPHLMGIRRQWEQALRKAVQELPAVQFNGKPPP